MLGLNTKLLTIVNSLLFNYYVNQILLSIYLFIKWLILVINIGNLSFNDVTHHLINLSLTLVSSKFLNQSSLIFRIIERLTNFMFLYSLWDSHWNIKNIGSLYKLNLLCLSVLNGNNIFNQFFCWSFSKVGSNMLNSSLFYVNSFLMMLVGLFVSIKF
jgi:hypothetical protein